MPRLNKFEFERRSKRQQQWIKEFLPRIQEATRPNAEYLQDPEVLDLLQHLSDGVNELLLARPLDPLPWLADYLRRACKLGYEVQNSVSEALILEMHRKRRIIQSALRDTKLDEVESKRLIRKIIALEQELKLMGRERQLKRADHVFLDSEQPSLQSNWSIDTTKVPSFSRTSTQEMAKDATVPTPGSVSLEPENTELDVEVISEQLRLALQSQRDLDSYFDVVVDVIVKALVNLLLIAPDRPALWLVIYLRHPIKTMSQPQGVSVEESAAVPRRSSSVALQAASPMLFTTNFELTRKLEEIKDAQLQMHTRLQAMQQAFTTLEQELAVRNRFIIKLSETHVTTRTQAIMDGTSVFLNSQKHWVLPGFLLVPKALSIIELQGLRRAESFLMEKDEVRWKFLLRTQLEYDSATLTQSMWRGQRAYHAFQELLRRRRRAATLIQRNYFHYLFTRAINLPRWCRPGREVIVAPSIAQKCAISFQFYPMKDFPTGNYRREPKGTSITELMDIARQDEMCAGFTTDGAFKRFLPRMLSQLKPMVPSDRTPGSYDDENDNTLVKLSDKDGLYVKVFPKKDEKLINSAIVVGVPEDRFGLIKVVLDGVAITETVPVTKLTNRWKRIRVKRLQVMERRKTRAIVFGKVSSSTISSDLEEEQSIIKPGTSDTSYERIESDEEDEEESLENERRRQRRLVRRRQQQEPRSQGGVDLDDAPDYIFEDLATGCILRRGHPKNTHEDPEVCAQVIATRKKEYEDEQHRRFEGEKLVSAVKIQCAWRSKRAREHFRQMLMLRAKERERERLVNEVGAANTHRQKAKKKSGGPSFFSKWRR